MSEFKDKSTKKIYLKSKYVLRKWEDDFMAKNGRLPTKADIKLSPSCVKQSYKKYYRIKTELLESQILGDNEDVKLKEDVLPTEVASKINNDSDSKTIVEKKSEICEVVEITKNFEKKEAASASDKNDSKTWGSHLNDYNVEEKKQIKEVSVTNVLSQKLFKGSTFKKRNPRKSSFNFKKKSSDTSKIVENCLTESNTSFCSNSSSQQTDHLLSSSLLYSTEKKSLFDKDVLSFVSSVPVLDNNDICNIDRVVPEEKMSSIQKVSLIQEISSDPLKTPKVVQNIQKGWMERCTNGTNFKEAHLSTDSGIDSVEDNSPESDIKEQSLVSETSDEKSDDSDDDIIIESDNESNNKTCSFFSQKRKSLAMSNEDTTSQSTSSVAAETSATPDAAEVKHIDKKMKIDPYEFKLSSQLKQKQEAQSETLARKIKAGTLNENYVKLNLEKKIYVRGKKRFNFSKYKKQQWKKAKKRIEDESDNGMVIKCFKCGEAGHYSRQCKKFLEDSLLNENDEGKCDDLLPSLEEAEALVKEKLEENNFKKKNVLSFEKPPSEIVSHQNVEPYCQLNDDGSVIETPPEVYEALKKFGHSNFRPGQEEAIMRILSGLSTLLTISTGGGKSLCYQLPAYLFAKRSTCITLVVSPLVSLMEDQVASSLSFFKSGCLHTGQTEKQRESVLEDAKNGKLYALLVSPEAVTSGDSSKGFGSIFKQFPPIAFACIDEVHCISQWSHNFRPSYLMINRVLKETLGISTVLGLTATATSSAIKSMVRELGISSEDEVIKDIPIPNNLCLTVSKDENKDEALLSLLKSSKFRDFKSILIYCTRRDECERLAVLIRTVLQNFFDNVQNKKSKLSWSAESYHAGMASARRKQVQRAFMSGNLRIVVATVAFGMGINKKDIRAVIHYNMPRNLESYVQEVGRAGRDGVLSHCHLFLDCKGRDMNELRRHIYSNSIDRHVLRKLLQRVFIQCECSKKNEKCKGHEVAFNCSETIQVLDIPEENIYTLLCYLELHEKKFIKVLAPAYINCRIKSYKRIYDSVKKCPPLAYAFAFASQHSKRNLNGFEFNVIEIANKIGWDSGLVKSQVKKLEWELNESGTWRKSGIVIEYFDLGFRVCSRGDMTPSELDLALDYLVERVEDQERRSSSQLSITHNILDHYGCTNWSSCLEDFDLVKSDELKNAVRTYFEIESLPDYIPSKKIQDEEFNEEFVIADVRALICSYRDCSFNARAVARIFHGIQSPNYPASIWYKCKFWRKHIDKDFNSIIRVAKREILRLKL